MTNLRATIHTRLDREIWAGNIDIRLRHVLGPILAVAAWFALKAASHAWYSATSKGLITAIILTETLFGVYYGATVYRGVQSGHIIGHQDITRSVLICGAYVAFFNVFLSCWPGTSSSLYSIELWVGRGAILVAMPCGLLEMLRLARAREARSAGKLDQLG